MTNDGGWFDRFVDSLPERGWFKFLSTYVVVPYWVWRDPKPKLPGGPRASAQPSENVQRMMNLIMPLKDSSPIGRAKAALAIAQNVDEIFAGLDNVGTVHTARFLLLDDYICMISVYDGDFSNYIRDFIATIGSVFDEVVSLVEGGDDLIPTTHNVERFIDWVHAHDLFQAPDFPTDLFGLQDTASGRSPDSPPHELRSLPRELILQLNANPNISLGGGYRAYPGFSAAQVRGKFGVGW
ncbi:hypothetical protein [Sedimentitalea nanhaiensis]|uniref:Uncharacterized protein n=1 Tax=Sedimentitalea nanhaiensis TaxID=999627 RepID=A0A1I7CZS0_9RHOB|nr:hypothetical protein [Sedimentitalea nanhaiensis]SFU04950.1 hypothetical protein SAMN05216236_12141 [Sedimentitalea nanhaiensis]